MPGALKNALDWASRPFPDNCLRGKPVAVIGASTSLFGAVWAQAELREVLPPIGARVIDRELPVPRAQDAFDSSGALGDPEPQITGSPVVELNRAVAVAEAGRTEQALEIVDGLDLDDYQHPHSTRGELLRRLGRTVEARAAFQRALELARSQPERRFFAGRIAEL